MEILRKLLVIVLAIGPLPALSVKEIWRWQNGTLAQDVVKAAAVDSAGDLFLTGYSIGNSSNFVAFKVNGSTGQTIWEWQDGTTGNDRLQAAAVDSAGNLLAGGWTESDWLGANLGLKDFVSVKLDGETGEILWTYQWGTTGLDTIESAAVDPLDNVIFGGFTDGNLSGIVKGEYDIVATKLDGATGEEIWRWQNGTTAADILYATAVDSAGDIFLGANSYGNFSGISEGDADFVVFKLDGSTGLELWRWQNGTTGFDRIVDASVDFADNIILGGYYDEYLDGINTGKHDMAVFKLEGEDGNGLWLWEAGTTNWTDEVNAVAVDEAGDIYCGGYSYSDFSGINAGDTDFVAVKLDGISGKEMERWQSGTGSTDRILATAVDSKGDLFAAGYTEGDYLDGNAGDLDFVAFKLEFTLVASTPSPSPSPPSNGGIDVLMVSVASAAAVVVLCIMGCILAGWRWSRLHLGMIGPKEVDSVVEPGGPVQRDVIANDMGSQQSNESPPPWDPAWDGPGLTAPASANPALVPVEQLHEDKTDGAETEICGCTTPPSSNLSLKLETARAVAAAAGSVAANSTVPLLAEAATLVKLLIELVSDYRGSDDAMQDTIRWCKSMVGMLEYAQKFLKEHESEHALALVEDVWFSIQSLVEIVKSYKRRGTISKFLTSSLCMKRKKEAETTMEKAMLRLQTGLVVSTATQQGTIVNQLDNIAAKQDRLADRICAAHEQDRTAAEQVRLSRAERKQLMFAQHEIPVEQVQFFPQEELGRGGFGVVCTVDYLGQTAAAKILDLGDLPIHSKDRERLRKTFTRELQALLTLRSPYIVQVYGAMTSQPDRMVLVMEFVSGGDLRSLLADDKFTIGLTYEAGFGIVSDVAAGIAFLHFKNVTHGDIKSPNVLLTADDLRAKISDFGTARVADEITSLTGGGSSPFTFRWCAPEVLDDEEPSHASDMFSFAVVAWEVVTRKLPWENIKRKSHVMSSVLKGKRPIIPHDTPTLLRNIIETCWASKPEDRLSASQVTSSLQAMQLDVV